MRSFIQNSNGLSHGNGIFGGGTYEGWDHGNHHSRTRRVCKANHGISPVLEIMQHLIPGRSSMGETVWRYRRYKRIFNTGAITPASRGLFLIHEILTMTGISIRKNGEQETGIRLEILVPSGAVRFIQGRCEKP
jgi:hypothetical protein